MTRREDLCWCALYLAIALGSSAHALGLI